MILFGNKKEACIGLPLCCEAHYMLVVENSDEAFERATSSKCGIKIRLDRLRTITRRSNHHPAMRVPQELLRLDIKYVNKS